MNEMIEIIRGLTKGGFYEFHGKFYDLPSVKMSPVPTSPIPILIGGHSKAALRRAASIGDGWMHAGSDADELGCLIKRLDELRAEYGRSSEPFEKHVISFDAYSVDGVHRLEDAGVSDVIVGFRDPYTQADTMPVSEKVEVLTRFADDVIAKI